MNANALFDAASSLELDNAQDRFECISGHESSLSLIVAELLYKNQLLRFKLSQSQALVVQLRLTCDRLRAHSGSATELQGVLNVLSTLLKPELEC